MTNFKAQVTPEPKALRVAALTCICGLMFSGLALAKPAQIPERLLQASEQAARAQMQISSMMAREIGQESAESVKQQDTRNLPDYMKQTVRLDFYGPMDEALNRLANDLGWRVASFGEPVVGGMKPHVYLRDAKPVHQHIAELGSQIPWSLLVDIRNERLVVDYRSRVGVERQIEVTRQHLDDNRNTTQYGQTATNRTLPNSYSAEPRTIATPNQPKYPVKNSSWSDTPRDPIEQTYNKDYSGWGVELGAYTNPDDARNMLIWLQERSLDVSARIDNGLHRIRLLAINQSIADSLRKYLLSQGIEGEIAYAPPEIVRQQLASSKKELHKNPIQNINATQFNPETEKTDDGNNGWRSKLVAPRTAMGGGTVSAEQGGSQSIRIASRHVTMPLIESTPKGYGVQTFTHTDRKKALQIAEDLRNKNLPAFVFKIGKYYGVRVGQLSRREQATNLMVVIRKMGFSDAYVVKAREGV